MSRIEKQATVDLEDMTSRRPEPKPTKSRHLIPAAKNISESKSESSII